MTQYASDYYQDIIEDHTHVRVLYQTRLSPTIIELIEKNGQFYILKKIRKEYLISENLRKQAFFEAEIHVKFQHENLIQAYKSTQTKDYVLILMEYVNDANYFNEKVEENLNPIKSEQNIKKYTKNILQGLSHLHKSGFVHCDIKLENLFLERGDQKKVKIGDFGLMQQKNSVDQQIYLQSSIGSFHYMAPELLKQKNNNLLIANDKIDIYSLGIVIYKLITAYHPKDLGPILSFRRADWENFSQHAQDFVEKCLDKNVDSRMDAKQALLHPWLSQ